MSNNESLDKSIPHEYVQIYEPRGYLIPNDVVPKFEAKESTEFNSKLGSLPESGLTQIVKQNTEQPTEKTREKETKSCFSIPIIVWPIVALFVISIGFMVYIIIMRQHLLAREQVIQKKLNDFEVSLLKTETSTTTPITNTTPTRTTTRAPTTTTGQNQTQTSTTTPLTTSPPTTTTQPIPTLLKPQSCLDHYKSGQREDRYYTIYYDGKTSMDVKCDMTNGGWTNIAERHDVDVYHFNKEWDKFKNGFYPNTQTYWIGLQKMHVMTRRTKMHLRIDVNKGSLLDDYFIVYDGFIVGSEHDLYRLSLGKKIYGTLPDAFSHQNNEAFSTFDNNHDTGNGNCASLYFSGWWFVGCYHACFSCQNADPGNVYFSTAKVPKWEKFDNFEMKIKPVES